MALSAVEGKRVAVPWTAPGCPEGRAEASIEGPDLKL